MVSKNQRKQILKLKQKKYRLLLGLFVAEGEKVVKELLAASWRCDYLFSIKENIHPKAIKIDLATMKQLTHFKTPSPVLAVFEIPKSNQYIPNHITIAVDGVTDPGNLGTIIRLCDWFGLNELICSSKTVDCFNSKVVQSTMGSIVRVTCRYETDLATYLKTLDKPIFGADSNGSSLYKKKLPLSATYVFGNESQGFSKEVNSLLNDRLSIPNLSDHKGADSLNVATCVAIFLSEIFRMT